MSESKYNEKIKPLGEELQQIDQDEEQLESQIFILKEQEQNIKKAGMIQVKEYHKNNQQDEHKLQEEIQTDTQLKSKEHKKIEVL